MAATDGVLQAIVDQVRANDILVTGDETAAMDEDDERRGLAGVGFPKIEDVAVVGPIGDVDKIGRPRGFALVLSRRHCRERQRDYERKIAEVHSALLYTRRSMSALHGSERHLIRRTR